jgi:hypothetical protein
MKRKFILAIFAFVLAGAFADASHPLDALDIVDKSRNRIQA